MMEIERLEIKMNQKIVEDNGGLNNKFYFNGSFKSVEEARDQINKKRFKNWIIGKFYNVSREKYMYNVYKPI